MEELLSFLRPDETAAELLARTYTGEPLATGVALIDREAPLRPGQVLELAGPPGSGKTDVLVQVRPDGVGWEGHWGGW